MSRSPGVADLSRLRDDGSKGGDMDEHARRVAAMQTIEAVKGQMGDVRQLLDDIELVLAARQGEDAAIVPVAPAEIGALIRQLEVLRLRLERLAAAGDAPGRSAP
jgi:hypothetical protein